MVFQNGIQTKCLHRASNGNVGSWARGISARKEEHLRMPVLRSGLFLFRLPQWMSQYFD